jgi:tetratricopeptide (TPR) repeat protein
VSLSCLFAVSALAQDTWYESYYGKPFDLYGDLTQPPAPDTPTAPPLLPVPPTVAAGTWDRLAFRGTAIRLHNEGVGLEANGLTADAARKYGEAIASWAAFPEAQYGLGAAMLRLRQPDQALVHLKEALRLKPGYVEASRGVTIALRSIAYRNRPAPPAAPEVIVRHRR